MTHDHWTGPADDPRRYRVTSEDDAPPVAVSAHGAAGVVYRARSGYGSPDGAERDVALKLRPLLRIRDAAELDRRCTLLRQLDHPGLMRPVDVFVGTALVTEAPEDLDDEDFDLLWIATEWVNGTPLTEATLGDTGRALRFVGELARAVQAMHDTRTDLTPDGIVHRDLKPSNVMVGADLSPVVIDYGSAGPVNEVWVPDGTPGWLAPEVVAGEPARQPADRWAVGAIAHQVLCGRPPQLDGAACSLERLRPPLRTAGLPKAEAIAAHVSRLLESDPARRPSDLARWADDLDRLREHAGRRRRRIGLVAAAVAVVAALSASTALFLEDEAPGERVMACNRGSDAESALHRPRLARLHAAIHALPHDECIRYLETIGRATAAHLSTTSGRSEGVMVSSPSNPALLLTDAEYASYRRFPIWSTTDAVVNLGGYPTAKRVESRRRAIVIELSRGGLLIGPRADSQLFWIPAESRAAWERSGGVDGWMGFPTSNLYFADGAIRQDFEGGFSRADLTLTAPGSPLPFGFVNPTSIPVDDPGAELSGRGPIENTGIVVPGGIRWWIDAQRVRHWIGDDSVAACLGVVDTPTARAAGVAVATLRLGPPATCDMARR